MKESKGFFQAFAVSFLHHLPHATAWSFRLYPIIAIVWLGALLMSLNGCGGTDHTTVELDMPAEQCVPGHHEACWCMSGATGHQVCREDGMAYGHCECPDDSGGDAGTNPEASTEDAGTEPDAEADSQADAQNDADPDTLLYIGQHGKGEDSFELGEMDAVVQTVEVCTYTESIEVRHIYFELQTLSQGAHVEGSQGTRYFTNARLKEFPDGATVSDPVELSSLPGETIPQMVNFNDSFILPANTCKIYGVYMDIADSEDEPGELVGQKYESQVHAIYGVIAGTTTDVGTKTEYGFGSGKDFTIEAAPEDCPPYKAQSSLNITESPLGHPDPTIVIGGKDTWIPMARYQACAQGDEDVKVSKIGVQWRTQNGAMSAESFSLIGVASEGYVLGAAQFDNNDPYGVVDVDLSSSLIVPNGMCKSIELWAKFAEVISSAAAGDEWSHRPRSGKDIALRIGESVPQYGYDAYCNVADYAGKLFVHSRGLTTGEKIFADEGAAQPNFMVIRKSKPVVTPTQLSNITLSAGEREIARWQVGADSTGSIAVKQLPFYTEWSAGVSLSSFRLYRGAFQIPLTDYSIVDMSTGADLKATSVSSILGAYPTVAFVDEEVVSGAGNLYSLRATVTASGVGHHINTKFINPGSGNITGVLVNNVNLMPPEVASPYLWHVQEPGGGYGVGTFLWSDLSEVPHGTASYDWTTGYLVEDLDHTWTLTN